jgi:hypothetical protein
VYKLILSIWCLVLVILNKIGVMSLKDFILFSSLTSFFAAVLILFSYIHLVKIKDSLQMDMKIKYISNIVGLLVFSIILLVLFYG